MSRARGEDQRVGDPVGVQRLLAVSLATFARNKANQEKLYEIKGDVEEERQRF